MKIYIDGLFFKGSGIGRYYESITKEFAKRGIEIYTAVPKSLKEEWYSEFGEYKTLYPIFVNYEKFSLKEYFLHSFILKKLEKKVDLYFYPHINLPYFIPKNTIITIHDLRPFTPYWDRNQISSFILKKLLLRASIKSKRIIVISNYVKNELIRFMGGEIGSKSQVIYRFLDDKFWENSKDDIAPCITEPYILFLGNRKKHKNLRNLLFAFDKIKKKINCKLVIAGTKDKHSKEDEVDKLIRKLKLEDFVIQKISPSDKEVISLYRNARLFVFPSLIEGFGLPPLEAIACGCPVITSNIPVLKEIYGTEIACFDPRSPEDIAMKINDILLNAKKRTRILNIGASLLKKFEKDKIV